MHARHTRLTNVRLAVASFLGALATSRDAIASGGYADIVQGVPFVAVPGTLGPVHPLTADWTTIVDGDEDTSFPATFLIVREYGVGRVAAFGHDGILSTDGIATNGQLIRNLVNWLDTTAPSRVLYTNGHGEWAPGGAAGQLATLLALDGRAVTAATGTITAASLSNCAVLIVGNAWGNFAPAEIETIRLFVQGGGGLILIGLGWSWEPFNPGQTLEDYPMTQLAAPFGVRWLRATISDPTDSFNGWVSFDTLYPDVEQLATATSLGFIQSTHATHGGGLPAQLESDAVLRRQFVHAHQSLAIPAFEYPTGHPDRQLVFDAFGALAEAYPAAYRKASIINQAAFPTTTFLRERMWRSWCDALPLTPTNKQTIISRGGLGGGALAVFQNHSLILLDNNRLGAAELDFIDRYMASIPASLHNLRSMSVLDYLGNPPTPIPLDGQPGAVNIFGLAIGDATENPFPTDVEPRVADILVSVVAHEVNHVVDAFTISPHAARAARRAELVAAAGCDPMNYLRSVVTEPCFFVNAPQEFFASISNQWFCDSPLVFTLGLTRFDAGRLDPINQALFFAEVYSQGGPRTRFYVINPSGEIATSFPPLRRDGQGRIDAITFGGQRIEFTLGAGGDVTAYQIVPLGDMNCDGVVTVGDIGGFVLALTNLPAYAQQYPACDANNADVSEDGFVTVSDIGPFVLLLTSR